MVDDVGRRKVDALADHLLACNPYVDVETHDLRLTPLNVFDVFQGCAVIVEALDGVDDKAMIMRSFVDARFSDTSLVAASGLAGAHSSNLIETRQLARHIYVCGDFVSEPSETHGVMAPRVMLVAAHQANMVVRLISGMSDV